MCLSCSLFVLENAALAWPHQQPSERHLGSVRPHHCCKSSIPHAGRKSPSLEEDTALESCCCPGSLSKSRHHVPTSQLSEGRRVASSSPQRAGVAAYLIPGPWHWGPALQPAGPGGGCTNNQPRVVSQWLQQSPALKRLLEGLDSPDLIEHHRHCHRVSHTSTPIGAACQVEQPPLHPVVSRHTDRNPSNSPQLAPRNATGLAPPAWGAQGQSSPGTCWLQGSHRTGSGQRAASPRLATSPRGCQRPPSFQRLWGRTARHRPVPLPQALG